LGIGGKDGKKGRGLVGWDEKGKDGKERERKGEKGKRGLDLDICPGAPEFLDSPLYPPHVWAPKIVTYKKSVRAYRLRSCATHYSCMDASDRSRVVVVDLLHFSARAYSPQLLKI